MLVYHRSYESRVPGFGSHYVSGNRQDNDSNRVTVNDRSNESRVPGFGRQYPCLQMCMGEQLHTGASVAIWKEDNFRILI
eukprot:PDM76263.1 hypothetical protein PRIPAC_39867 [Pristionchus pacificus]